MVIKRHSEVSHFDFQLTFLPSKIEISKSFKISFLGLPSLPSSGLDHGSSVTGVNLIKLFLFVTDSGVGGLSRLTHKC
jgi:hypothetical protein